MLPGLPPTKCKWLEAKSSMVLSPSKSISWAILSWDPSAPSKMWISSSAVQPVTVAKLEEILSETTTWSVKERVGGPPLDLETLLGSPMSFENAFKVCPQSLSMSFLLGHTCQSLPSDNTVLPSEPAAVVHIKLTNSYSQWINSLVSQQIYRSLSCLSPAGGGQWYFAAVSRRHCLQGPISEISAR